jgi:hypothetical protein
VSATREAAEMGWTALMEEDRLLTRIESLENQLVVSSKVRRLIWIIKKMVDYTWNVFVKNFHEDKLREEIRKLYDEKNIYQDVSKESLRKVLTEKMETLKKLQETERWIPLECYELLLYIKGFCVYLTGHWVTPKTNATTWKNWTINWMNKY